MYSPEEDGDIRRRGLGGASGVCAACSALTRTRVRDSRRERGPLTTVCHHHRRRGGDFTMHRPLLDLL